jgi:hypothetical protein
MLEPEAICLEIIALHSTVVAGHGSSAWAARAQLRRHHKYVAPTTTLARIPLPLTDPAPPTTDLSHKQEQQSASFKTPSSARNLPPQQQQKQPSILKTSTSARNPAPSHQLLPKHTLSSFHATRAPSSPDESSSINLLEAAQVMPSPPTLFQPDLSCTLTRLAAARHAIRLCSAPPNHSTSNLEPLSTTTRSRG